MIIPLDRSDELPPQASSCACAKSSRGAQFLHGVRKDFAGRENFALGAKIVRASREILAPLSAQYFHVFWEKIAHDGNTHSSKDT